MTHPTDQQLKQANVIALVLIIFAIVAPLLALTLPRPDSIDLGNWFGRSGAVTTVFALLAEVQLVKARLSITPAGFGWVGLNEQRRQFLPMLDLKDRWIFALTIIGTVIWAYGDLPFAI